MTRVDIQTMKEVNGGSLKWVIIGTIAAAITFVIGLFDGYTNPTKCNN